MVEERFESSTLGPETLVMMMSWLAMMAPVVVSLACQRNSAVSLLLARMVSGCTNEVRVTPRRLMLTLVVLSPTVAVTVATASVAAASAVRVVLWVPLEPV